MKTIVILALHGGVASSITSPMDVFHLAGLTWGYSTGHEIESQFQVKIASVDGKPVRCANQLYIEPHCDIHEVKNPDLIMICSISDMVDRVLEKNIGVIDWLTHRHRSGSHIASICTGAFVLAETGLLNGKSATTHWGFADLFRQRYPLVHLKPERLVVDEGDLYCSGGANSSFDLTIYLIEKMVNREVATQYAKAMVHDIGRFTQAPFAACTFCKDHHDQQILGVQKWIEKNYAQGINISLLAGDHGMSLRAFERRFKKATGDSPLFYLQKVRIEAAKALLEKAHSTFEEVTYHVGYEDVRSFRKIFQRHTGLSPKEYQRLYHQRVVF
jgi:transcriptional regulator GlxA family with amidase domain